MWNAVIICLVLAAIGIAFWLLYEVQKTVLVCPACGGRYLSYEGNDKPLWRCRQCGKVFDAD